MGLLVVSLMAVLPAQLAGSPPAKPAIPSTREAIAVVPEAIFDDARAVCARDRGMLWRRPLCGPMMVVNRRTRSIVANQGGRSAALKRDGGVFRGVLPANVVVANTAVEWDGVRWTMIVGPMPDSAARRRSLATHENFHRIQPGLGLTMASPTPAHLATADGRTAMRMEWRALAVALQAADRRAAGTAIADALLFRTARRTAAGEPGANDERELELNEGLAEYTAVRLTAKGPDAAAARALAAAESGRSYPRSFAYASGPAYGLLLDRFGPGWRRRLDRGSDLGAMLAAATGTAISLDGAAIAMARARYGFAVVASVERETERVQAEANARWVARLVTGPVLRVPFSRMNIGFDPNTLSPLPPHGTVYPTMTVTDVWGVLEVTGGGLIDGGWQGATVPAPTSSAATGDGWTLRLEPGWRISPSRRAGDYVVERIPKAS